MIKMSSNHLLFRHVLPFFLSIPLLGGCNAFLPRDNGSTALPPLSSTTTEKYVKAHRVYDCLYEPDGYGESTFTLEAFPGVVFESKANQLGVNVQDSELLYRMLAIYTCDFNLDGAMDIAFVTYVQPGSSSHNDLRSRIYDFKNEGILYDSGVEGSHTFDLDDEGHLVLEEHHNSSFSPFGFCPLARVGRFLTADQDIEWFEPDFKVKAAYMDSTYYSLSKKGFNIPTNVEATIWVDVNCTGKENLLTLDSISVQTNGDRFDKLTYRIEQQETARGRTSRYYLYCTISGEDSFDLTVTVDGVSCTEKVFAYNK